MLPRLSVRLKIKSAPFTMRWDFNAMWQVVSRSFDLVDSSNLTSILAVTLHPFVGAMLSFGMLFPFLLSNQNWGCLLCLSSEMSCHPLRS